MVDATATGRSAASQRATLVGGTAVLLWSTMAILTTAAGAVPPFLLVMLTFAIGGLIGLLRSLATAGGVRKLLAVPPVVWVVGIGGLFGFHALYFVALQNAPPAQASLVNYLWPVLIVLFASLLPGERLRWFHLAGAGLGLLGTIVLLADGGGLAFASEHLVGYLAALGCAITWAGYSVLSRRYGAAPTEAVGGFCLATALLATLCHLLFEPTIWPAGTAWLAVLGMGLGPVGIAFYAWDVGVKRGDIRALAAASYLAPPLSTLLLVAFGAAEARWSLALACLLIVGGAVLAGWEMWRSRRAAIA